MNSTLKGSITWAILVATTLAAYFITDAANHQSLNWKLSTLLAAASIKSALIFYIFMEMKYSHRGWPIAFFIFLSFFFSIALSL